MPLQFQTVDVFSAVPCMGNPVAVFLNSEGLTSEIMQRIARWTNLSETTFVTSASATEYSVRIFTPLSELPFAGHPTLGTAWALKQANILRAEHAIQNCAYGKVQLHFRKDEVYFDLPHFESRPAAIDEAVSYTIDAQARLSHVITTGPVWIVAQLLEDVDLYGLNVHQERLLQLFHAQNATGICVYQIDEFNKVHVRTFFESFNAVVEDPVCGSGNAAVAVHIRNAGLEKVLGTHYEARQGHALKRDGRISVLLDEKISIGGQCHSVLVGSASGLIV